MTDDTALRARINPRSLRRRRVALTTLLVNLLLLVVAGLALPWLWPTMPSWILAFLLAAAMGILIAELLVPRLRPKPVPDAELLRREDGPQPIAVVSRLAPRPISPAAHPASTVATERRPRLGPRIE